MDVAQELYKKNLELFNTNQALSLLQKLYATMISTYDINQMSYQFIDLIVKDLDFNSGVVFLKDPAGKRLNLVAFTPTPLLSTITAEIGPNIGLNLGGQKNLLLEVIDKKSPLVTTNFFDLWDAWLPSDRRTQLGLDTSTIKTIFVYPIVAQDASAGLFAVLSDKMEADLSMSQRNLLQELTNVFGVAVDRAKLYKDVQVANEKLTSMGIKKDEFLNVVAHELRAPMTAIKGYISMLVEGDAGEQGPEAKEYLNLVSKSNDRVIRLVNNLLNVSRIEEGRQVYNMQTVGLLDVIKTNFEEFKFTADEKHIQMSLFLGDPPPSDKVYVDSDRIYEVIANFMSNAIKYTDAGNVAIKVYNPSPNSIKVEVSDSGRGIAPLDQKKIFQKYYRAEQTVQRTVGTGLGLYISKLLIEKFGGTLGFTSEMGKGSTFWFELPLAQSIDAKPNIVV